MTHDETRNDIRGVVGLLPWGDVWEDFYGTLGIPFEQFCETFTGSWQFGLVSALRAAGLHTVIYYSSTMVSEVTRVTHKPSGATICLIPAPTSYRRVYRRMIHPHHSMGYWKSLEELFGEVGSRRYLYEAARQVAPFIATSLRRLGAEMRRDGCRALVCQDYEGPQFEKAVAVGKMARVPVYAIFQGGVNDWNRIGRTVRPRTMKLAAGFIIGPQAEIARVTKAYGVSPQKIHRIFNVVADDYFVAANKREARDALGIDPGTVVVAWHGRVQRQKGLDIARRLGAGDRNASGAGSVCLMLMGSGPDADALRQRLEGMGRRDIVWFDEFVDDRSRIRQFLAAADIYAFPSRWEGLPVAPTEAMALGLPVVAANASGVRDIFEKGERSGGIVVKRGDAGAFAVALGRLIDDAALRDELGNAPCRGRRRRFTAEAVGRELAAALKLEPARAKESLHRLLICRPILVHEAGAQLRLLVKRGIECPAQRRSQLRWRGVPATAQVDTGP
jgi:glycosyltransferase involved in cell wall biosynthesis